MYPPILRAHLNKDQRKTYQMMLMWYFCVFFVYFLYKSICCGYSFELHRQVDAIQMGTHNICLNKVVDKKNTGCNLKTMESLDCALIGVCALIRSNMVRTMARFLMLQLRWMFVLQCLMTHQFFIIEGNDGSDIIVWHSCILSSPTKIYGVNFQMKSNMVYRMI